MAQYEILRRQGNCFAPPIYGARVVDAEDPPEAAEKAGGRHGELIFVRYPPTGGIAAFRFRSGVEHVDF